MIERPYKAHVTKNKSIVHIVSAYGQECLGELKIDDKSDEIIAMLDVAFNEDNSRKRVGHAIQNFSVMNRIVLNLLKNEMMAKYGIKGKHSLFPYSSTLTTLGLPCG